MAEVKGQVKGTGEPKEAVPAKEIEKLQLPSASGLWDSTKAPEYGGTTPILDLAPGAAVGPLTYVGINPMTIDGKVIEVHIAQTVGGEGVRLPIAAAFIRAMQQSHVNEGDKFLVKRYDDTAKKSGIGKGQAMQIYGIKVVERAPVSA